MLVTRAWLSAVQSRDSLAVDSLSAPGEGLEAAQHLESRGSAFIGLFAGPAAQVRVSSVQADSAFVEVRASSTKEPVLGIVLARRSSGWGVASAAQFRRD